MRHPCLQKDTNHANLHVVVRSVQIIKLRINYMITRHLSQSIPSRLSGRNTLLTKSMPSKKKKNQGRNAFYYFMISLRPQLERQGVVLENGMQTLAEIAGPRWKVTYATVL